MTGSTTSIAILCLGFTGSAVAWAEPTHTAVTQGADYIEDPYAPHHTSGTIARIGTAVGTVYGERRDVEALGLTVAGGQRWGRLALETEYAYLSFQELGAGDTRLGRGQRLGVLGRFDVLRLDSRVVGANSLFAIYVEGGAGVAWNQWYKPGYDEASRLVPDDTKRVEGNVGFGISIDHRLQEPVSFPRRVGWFLGWRGSVSPHESEVASVCRGEACRAATPMPETSYVDRSMLFQSSLMFTW